ncbi:MAG: energy-coupling factor transporter transmembrane protein EcfT [Erysipelotrichaceae bacterium]|nr:energy-coupling factor transporter transmembrane protein EcfT [Erysipelotrichaceae bacterium]
MDREFAYSYNDYVKYGNGYKDMNPISKLTISVCLGIASCIVHRWQFGVALCIIGTLAAIYTRIFKKYIKSLLVIAVPLLLLTSCIRQLQYAHLEGNQPIFKILGWQWYDQPFIASMDIAWYIIGFSSVLLVYFMNTEMKDLMLALENRGVTHVASYIMLSSIQSIIDMKKSADTILESQKARGIETDGNIIVRMKAFFPTLGPILLSAMSGTEEKAIAMDARAFSHEGGHTYLRVLRPIPWWEYILDAIAILVLVGSIVYQVMKTVGAL